MLKGFESTYIGSDAGVIVRELAKAGTTKVLIQLDEVDKLGIQNGVNASNALEIYLSNYKETGFSKGFYSDEVFVHDPTVQFFFASVKPDKSISEESTFVRMSFSFDCNEENYPFYQPKIRALKKRAEYFFIPMVSHFGYETHLDERFTLDFDVIVPNMNDVLNVCYCLLNLIIAILAFED